MLRFAGPGFLLVVLLAGGASAATTEPPVATIDGVTITHEALERKLEASPSAKQVFTQMVQALLIDRYAKDHGIVIPAADVAAKEADITSKYPPGQFAAILKQQGLTEADVQTVLRQQLVIDKAVAPKVHVTDADISAYFDKNAATLNRPEQVRARHILVADEATADAVKAKLDAGASFADLAHQYSTDPSTKDKGGELGFFGHGQMIPAFDAAAFSLAPGTISAPVQSPFGWHIINVEEKRPAVIATLAGSRDNIRATLVQQQEQQQIPVFLQQLRVQAKIQIFDEQFKDAFPPPAGPPAATGLAPAPAQT
jgi:foldase protein PrsA